MLDIEALRKQAESVPTVTIDSKTLLSLLDSVIVVTLNGVKQRAKREKAAVNPDDEKCAHWLFKVLQKTAPKARTPNFPTWTNEVRLMRERDGRAHKEICELFLWAHKHDFWCGNILGPKALREHWDQLTIQQAKAAEPKKTGGAWWASEASIRAKGEEIGLKPLAHESWPDFKGRIQAAIENGGKPPEPAASAVPIALVPPPTERRGVKPEGLDLKALLRPKAVGASA